MSSNPNPVPRLALRPEEAAAAMGISRDHLERHVAAELKWIRRGRLKLVSVTEIQRWLDQNSERTIELDRSTRRR